MSCTSRWSPVAVVLWLVASLASCGGGEAGQPHTPAGAPAVDLDGDALALLPPGAVAAATLDARALYDNHTLGAEVARLAEALIPVGNEAGFVPSRDIDRVTVAWYALTGADFVAVIRGHMDAAAIQKAADLHASGRGGVLTATPYSGHTIFTVADAGFSVLTARTSLVGTAGGLRLALDRIKDGRVRSEVSPAVAETLATKDAAMAFAGEFASSPLAGIQGLPIPPWVSNVRGIRATGVFREGRLLVAGAVAFTDPGRAASGADGMRQVGALVNAVAMSGVVPDLKNLDVAADGSSVKVSFGVDEGKLASVLQQAPQWIPRREAQGSTANPH